MKTTMKLLAATALLGTGAIAGGALIDSHMGAYASEGYGMEGGKWGAGGKGGKGYRKGKRGGGMGRMMERLKMMDTDGNGEVSREEFVQNAEARFAELDANTDTALDGEELIARQTARKEWRVKRRMRVLDTNNDGRVTKEELEAQVRERFSYRDLNDDGKIDRDDRPPRGKKRGGGDGDDGAAAAEAESDTDGVESDSGAAADTDAGDTASEDGGNANADKRYEARKERRKGWRGYGRRKGPRTIEQALQRAERRFNRMDANSDGAVDLAEMSDRGEGRDEYRIKRRLKRLDTNKDGTVSKQEFVAVRSERFRRWDLDDDGAITAKDLPPGMAQRWEKK